MTEVNYVYTVIQICLKNTNKQECVLALYNGDKTKIHNLCIFRFVHNAITPTIRQLNYSHILVINITSISLSCPSGSSTLPLLQIPCNCSISSPEYSLTKRHTGCHDNYANTSIMHLVNLILCTIFWVLNKYSIFIQTALSLFL